MVVFGLVYVFLRVFVCIRLPEQLSSRSVCLRFCVGGFVCVCVYLCICTCVFVCLCALVCDQRSFQSGCLCVYLCI